ncbi:MAG: TolC family protein [Candidatus Velthaea sp.]
MHKAWLAAAFAASMFPFAGAEAAQPAAPILTLAAAVQRVQQVGFDVRMARGEATIAEADARAARVGLRPQLGISAVALNANEPQLGMPVARQAYGAASLTVPLFAPAARAAASAAAANAGAAATTVEGTANDAVLSVVQTYRRAQLADAVLAARQVAVRDQQDHLRVTELRVAAGRVPRYTLARDRAGVAVAVQAAEDAAAERDQARNDLATQLDMDVSQPPATEPLTMVAFDESAQLMLTRALRERPSLRAAEQRVTAARASVLSSRDAYLPTTQVTAQTYNGAATPALGSAGSQVQIAVTLPIVDGGSRSAAVLRASGELDRATAARDQLRRGVERDVANALRELSAARANLATAEAAQADADEQLRVARLRESSGKGIEVEVLDALSVAANSRETVLRSLARYDNAVAGVRHAVGDRTP